MHFTRSKKSPPELLNSEVEEFLRSLNLVVGLDQLLDILSAKLRDLSGARSVYVVLD